MNRKFTRRNVIQTIGASAIAASTACTTTSPSSSSKGKGKGVPKGVPRLNLICHGMMLYYWKKTDPDYITILVPPSPVDPITHQNLHVIAFSRFPGGQPMLLSQSGIWTLDFGASPALTQANSSFTKPMNNTDVVFDKYPLSANAGAILYQIRVPYPSSVRRYYVGNYPSSAPPYVYNPSGPVSMDYTTRDFAIHPASMTGTHVFTYDHINTMITLTHTASGDMQTISGAPVVNLHLYSQPAKKSDYDFHHIHVFNEMVGYTDSNGNMHAKLDLTVLNAAGSLDADPSEPDLSTVDTAELSDLLDPNTAPPPGVDPASCLQGWGC
jgi:hypothetical protein